MVATAGLPQMITATRFDGPDPLEDPRALLDRSAEARRLVDLSGTARNPEGMATYVLIAIVKKELQLDASLLSVSVFEKTEISCALQPDAQADLPYLANQLNLFDFCPDSSEANYSLPHRR